MAGDRDYLLGTHAEEIARLALQHRVWRPRATDAWRRAGFTIGQTILDVGCGLGDNAQCFAAAGARVTAFDFVSEAVQWAKQRFPATKVTYAQGDLFALPEDWRQNFDLVHECYTLQALSSELIPQALAALKSALAPGGKLLIVARARDEADEIKVPPWPLPPSVFDEAKRQGLAALSIEDIPATAEFTARHWRALLRRAEEA